VFGFGGDVCAGVSTRKVKEVTEALCGTSFSKSLVSSLAGPRLRARSVEGSSARGRGLPYVFVDAHYEKARVGQRVLVCQSGFQSILACLGIRLVYTVFGFL
jgi:transposase-like protein